MIKMSIRVPARAAEVARRASLVAVVLACAPLLALAASRQVSSAQPLALDSSVTILVDGAEPAPVRLAAEDLAGDLERVFGAKPSLVNRAADAGPTTILIGHKSELINRLDPTPLPNTESFSISTATAHWTKRAPTRVVLLKGADLRGTIYAVYQFSEEFLGTDPMYYWTDQEPVRRTRIEIPGSLHKTYPAPVFQYRGFFVNDEDLLTGWAPAGPGDHTGISLEVWNKIFETILRLKGNMVAPGTWIFPDEPQVKLASRRGLIITQHHAIPLGMNVARWPENVPYSYTEHPEILERAWKDAVGEYAPDQEVLWTLGLRGLSDASYATFDPLAGGSDQKLGELITRALADQMRIVRAVRPDAKFITNLWQEGARLKKEGYLKILPEVAAVWPDTGYGYLQDNGEVQKGEGAYYHVAMYNAMANQLTEMIPADRVQSELGRYIRAGATHYLLINTSDIRPVAMMTKAVMDIAWAGLHAPNDRDFYRTWSAEEFGEAAAPQIAKVYKDYFQAPAHRPGTEPALEYGDNYYHTEARRLLLTYMVGSPLYPLPGQTPKWVRPSVFTHFRGQDPAQWIPQAARGEIERCQEAQARWDTLWEKAVAAESLVAPERKPFYGADVLAMITIQKESNRMLALVAQAVLAAQRGERTQAREAAQRALATFDEIDRAEAAAEYGKWKNWYRGDWLTGIYRTRQAVQDFLRYLDDPLGHMAPPIFWTGWEAYYQIMRYEGDRTTDVR